MGHSHSVQHAFEENQQVEVLVMRQIAIVKKEQGDTEQSARDYINAHTKGLIDGGTIAVNSNYFTHFTSHFDLNELGGLIDNAINTAKISLESEAEGALDAGKLVDSIGKTVKAALGLAVTDQGVSSQNKYMFFQFREGNQNLAFYMQYSTAIIDVSSCFSSSSISVTSMVYLLALVEPNPDITRAEIRQGRLDTLSKLHQDADNLLVKIADELVNHPEDAETIMKQRDAVMDIKTLIEDNKDLTLFGSFAYNNRFHRYLTKAESRQINKIFVEFYQSAESLLVDNAKDLAEHPRDAGKIIRQLGAVNQMQKLIKDVEQTIKDEKF